MSHWNPANLNWPESDEVIHYDWNSRYDTEGDAAWDCWEPTKIEHGRVAVFGTAEYGWRVYSGRTGQQLTLDEGIRPAVEIPDAPEGPMMNFFWPLTRYLSKDPYEVARDIAPLGNVCLTYVAEHEMWGIALTGGGMDLSWSLAGAAVAAGYYPWAGLSIYQGSPSETWKYGVSEIGEQWAARVKRALRYRLRADRSQLGARLKSVEAWG